VPFQQENLQAVLGQHGRSGQAAQSCADDNRVVFLGHVRIPEKIEYDDTMIKPVASVDERLGLLLYSPQRLRERREDFLFVGRYRQTKILRSEDFM
jgi:hypothetical protein